MQYTTHSDTPELMSVPLRAPHRTLSSTSGKDLEAIIAEEVAQARKLAAENVTDTSDSVEGAKTGKGKGKTGASAPDAEPKVSIRELFQYADGWDRIMIALGIFFAAGAGAVQPIMTIIFSNIIGTFTNLVIQQQSGDPSAEDNFNAGIVQLIIYFLMLAAGSFIFGYGETTMWMISGERQCKRMRELYYQALLRQDIAFFDGNSTGDLTSRLSGDINLIQDGMSEKIGLVIQSICTFIAGFTVAFVRGWQVALVMLAAIPLLMIAGAFMSRAVASRSKQGQDAYGRAGHLAEEVLSAIKTVAAFGGEQQEIARYEVELESAMREGVRRAVISGIGLGCMIFIMFGAYGLAFWYGSIQVAAGTLTGAQVLNVVFAMIIGAFALGMAAPNFAALATAQGAAVKIFSVIQRKSAIDSSSPDGRILQSTRGKLEFRSITFQYPSRPDVTVLKDFSLTVKPGETVALVGSSGSGKSTIVGLTERFYDPSSGTILVDDLPIDQINIKSLRKHIGLVSQEPVLFGVSIYQNVAWGSTSDDRLPTREEVVDACKMANAHEFITKLPQGYDTLVGQKGALLSGGQKQRIAIARALVKNPPILLLDEATSALDTESEHVVQAALDRLASHRTTLVIAHRLSTIKNADRIVVMDRGVIQEIGRHDELIERRGMYAKLVRAQELKKVKGAAGASHKAEVNDSESSELLDEDDVSGADYIPVAKALTRSKTHESARDKEALQKQHEEELAKRSLPWRRIFALNKPEIGLVIFGTIGSMIDGAVMPLFSLIFSSILSVFSDVTDPVQMQNNADFWAFMFGILGSVSFFSAFARVGIFAASGERLTKRLRLMSFTAMLRQEMGFFDMTENGSGLLSAKLATEAEQIRGLSGQVIGVVIQAASSLGVGLGIAFANGWQLTLVVLSCVPLIGLATALQTRTLTGFGTKTKKAYEEAAQIASESVENMRTVASLTREETFRQLYARNIVSPHRLAIRGALISSLGFGLSQALVFLVYCVAFYYGSRLVLWGTMDVAGMFRVLFAVVFSATAVGRTASYAPSIAKAKVAAISLFDIIDRVSKINPSNPQGRIVEPFNGKVSARNVQFKYPARPEITILRDFNIDVRPGATVALVGASGCGKSTIISLVQRFYDVEAGRVAVQDVDVREWQVSGLRAHMSLVGQEPVLFDRTIEENIAYGIDNASHEMVVAAAKSANIHQFIVNLPDGYNTRVGERGAQLSGGQKQRVAIARAVIRNPRLLLLDEATSALDTESEKIVQHALDQAAKGRTTITIAHRLSTVQDADLIYVMKNGLVVEQGKHAELIALRGLYSRLVQRQTLGAN